MTEPGPMLEQAELDRLTRAVGRALVRAAGPDWRRVRAEYRAAGRHVEVDLVITGPDGAPRQARPPAEVVDGLGKLRAGMYRPGRGTWIGATYEIEPPGAFTCEFEPDLEPTWRRVPPPIGFADELRTFPRSEEFIPDWFRARAGLPPAVSAETQAAHTPPHGVELPGRHTGPPPQQQADGSQPRPRPDGTPGHARQRPPAEQQPTQPWHPSEGHQLSQPWQSPDEHQPRHAGDGHQPQPPRQPGDEHRPAQPWQPTGEHQPRQPRHSGGEHQPGHPRQPAGDWGTGARQQPGPRHGGQQPTGRQHPGPPTGPHPMNPPGPRPNPYPPRGGQPGWQPQDQPPRRQPPPARDTPEADWHPEHPERD
ncbi:hypothetical protein [Actinokineospora sp. NBRC 105648]|uniref:hypothetical protein n=1 Tax=Actinokineospora sp. NBRC 105648 TaxID=3032206 RepID=UPI002554761B|nr:hypothetical protein [Actinokineospora sp. NBRC 105648]